MSTKFEQLLDYLVNEEMEKANELFHEIVVEKSREIYENLITQEAEEIEEDETDEDLEEGDDLEEDDDDLEEDDDGLEEDENTDEDLEEGDTDLEDSYMMDADDDSEMPMGGGDEPMGGDATDKFSSDIEADGEESEEDEAILDIKNAIEELEAAFSKLQDAQGGGLGMDSDMDMKSTSDDDDDETDEMMGMPAMEGKKRMTREYVEKVAKPSGDVAGANTGEKMSAAETTESPINKKAAATAPKTGATPKNILGKSATANEDGTKPHGKVGGVLKQGGKFVGNSTHNVDGVKSGIKTLSKVSGGHGAEKKSGPEGHAVGAGSGENSVKGATNTKSIVDKKQD